LIFVVLFEAVLVPLVWVGLSLVLVRGGARRDGLISALLLCSATVALGIACWLLATYTIPSYRMGSGTGIAGLALHAATITALFATVLFLSCRLRRGRRDEGGQLTSHSSRPAAPAADLGH
jgi:ammonia channel protein AmtB